MALKTLEEFKSYWSEIILRRLIDKGFYNTDNLLRYRVEKFVRIMDGLKVSYGLEVYRFRYKEIHDDAVKYLKEYDIIGEEEYPFTDEESVNFINQIIVEKEG